MDAILKKQLEGIVQGSEAEEWVVAFMKRALEIDIPPEDAWLLGVFKTAALLLKETMGEKANLVLPWMLFTLGMAYERGYRHHELRQGENL